MRIPPRHSALTPSTAASLIKAAWYSNLHQPPSKFVVLLDTDHAEPSKVVEPFRQQLPSQLPNIDATVMYAYAEHHLEAWYFADPERLQGYLGRNLGSVNVQRPDELDNPKLHLKHLLGERVYTARVSEAIAAGLVPDTIAQRSPSFAGFVEACLNGAREANRPPDAHPQ